MLPQTHVLIVTALEADNIVSFLGNLCWTLRHIKAIISPVSTVHLLCPLVHFLNK